VTKYVYDFPVGTKVRVVGLHWSPNNGRCGTVEWHPSYKQTHVMVRFDERLTRDVARLHDYLPGFLEIVEAASEPKRWMTMNDLRKQTSEGSVGLLKTSGGYQVTTWSKQGRLQESIALTVEDAKALRELFEEAERG